jgi:hypothetical protein
LGERNDRREALLVFGLALGLHVGAAVLAVRPLELPLTHLGVYFDGHVYIEIAKSFPLPYASEGRHYLGHAPGYPALIALLRALAPGLVNWGAAALLASWLPAALAAVAFHALCRAAGCRALWPSLLFVVGNPRWFVMGSTAHAEPLAMLFTLLAMHACLRGWLARSVGALGLASLVRFPALLVGPAVAFGFLVTRRRLELRSWLALAAPLLLLAALQLYLYARIPGFRGMSEEHRVFWDVRLAPPFAFLLASSKLSPRLLAITLATLLFYLAALVIGLRPAERERWPLALWIAGIVLFHVSLEGELAIRAFTRLAVLAWPAALLIVWRCVGARVPAALAAALCLAGAIGSVAYASGHVEAAVVHQTRMHAVIADEIRLLDHDEPHWVDFATHRRRPPPPP